MNHTVRAKGIVGRCMPQPEKHLGGWYENFVEEVARGLRQTERDARRRAIRQSANRVGELGLGDRELNLKIARQILALERER
jgi:hypothetical protein